MLASEADNVVPRAIRAVKEAVHELAVATDVCVCAYTAHGQCVLFGAGGADVNATLERLGAIARVHADAGADLLIPSGMLDGSVRALRTALGAAGRDDVPGAAGVEVGRAPYGTPRAAGAALPVTGGAGPPVGGGEAGGARGPGRPGMGGRGGAGGGE